ncbi:hypothetical protein BRADI_4g12804v3 [Brachypodium distachyon]|uniref:Uncharacterized protein n=1 Tax=Brachypodium distachyon TaxID=15368 RepID=A0A0Q3H2L5_BRADI|nr:hypothetical protein BRADI_4g12804v3 [Brachypodium distachyon]
MAIPNLTPPAAAASALHPARAAASLALALTLAPARAAAVLHPARAAGLRPPHSAPPPSSSPISTEQPSSCPTRPNHLQARAPSPEEHRPRPEVCIDILNYHQFFWLDFLCSCMRSLFIVVVYFAC